MRQFDAHKRICVHTIVIWRGDSLIGDAFQRTRLWLGTGLRSGRGALFLALAILLAVAISPAHADSAIKTFSISIDGSAGVRVVAACLVNWGEEIDVVTLKGEVPQTRKVEAVGLSCQIQKVGRAGRLVVEISKNGRVVSRNASSGSSSVISLSLQ